MSYWRHGKLERQRRLGFAKILLFLFREELILLVSRTAIPCDKRIHDGRLSCLKGRGFDVRCAVRRFPKTVREAIDCCEGERRSAGGRRKLDNWLR